MGEANTRWELDELAELGARREGKGGAALVLLVGQVELHMQAANDRVEAEIRRLQPLIETQDEDGPAARRAVDLVLFVQSLRAVRPRAAKSRAVVYSFHLICIIVLVLAELVIALSLVLNRDRLLAPRADAGTFLLYALAFQFLLIPLFLRWLERKLLWETYDDVLRELDAALAGVEGVLRQ